LWGDGRRRLNVATSKGKFEHRGDDHYDETADNRNADGITGRRRYKRCRRDKRVCSSGTALTATGVRAVFAVPNYRRFVTGQSVSLIGSWTETIALALLVLDLTHSSLTLGFVMATRYLPVLVGTPYAGLIVDRHDKRHVLMMTNTVLGLTSLAIGAAVLTHTVAMWQIFASATVFGVMACSMRV